MSRISTSIGPQDHGRRMTLDEFDLADGQPGYVYELSRGVVTVVDIPNPRHFAQFNAVRHQLAMYEAQHSGVIHGIAGGAECKILVDELQSERHPVMAIYTTPMPDGEEVWANWVPALVVEIVSAGSEQRDYHEKPEEYLRFGVREYWIIDESKQQMLAMKRSRGRWVQKVVAPGESYRTSVLPDFPLDLAAIFAAAAKR
jgi:hypothetical protein